MGAITWGLNRDRLATVFCINCKAVFAREIQPHDASGIIDSAGKHHHCTPQKPWRPGR